VAAGITYRHFPTRGAPRPSWPWAAGEAEMVPQCRFEAAELLPGVGKLRALAVSPRTLTIEGTARFRRSSRPCRVRGLRLLLRPVCPQGTAVLPSQGPGSGEEALLSSSPS